MNIQEEKEQRTNKHRIKKDLQNKQEIASVKNTKTKTILIELRKLDQIWLICPII